MQASAWHWFPPRMPSSSRRAVRASSPARRGKMAGATVTGTSRGDASPRNVHAHDRLYPVPRRGSFPVPGAIRITGLVVPGTGIRPGLEPANPPWTVITPTQMHPNDNTGSGGDARNHPPLYRRGSAGQHSQHHRLLQQHQSQPGRHHRPHHPQWRRAVRGADRRLLRQPRRRGYH